MNAQTTTPKAGKILSAFMEAQKAIKPIRANAQSHHGKFANIEAVWGAIKPHTDANNIAVIQLPMSSAAGTCTVLTRLVHNEDESEITSTITIPMQRANDPQAYGAAMTYGRRYALMCMFNMVTEDDDAASTSITLEKLLREIGSCSSIEELNSVRDNAYQNHLHDKFWARVYRLILEQKQAVLLEMHRKDSQSGAAA